MTSETGQRVGDYEVLALLGSGGMGRVYKVRNVISNREEAMKILLPDFAAEPELANRFMSEIRILAGLEHPNIAQLRTAFKVQNHFVMVMEYVEGVGLDKLAPQSPASLDTLLDYSSQVLAALSYAHGRGVTHRDIKPANIMITSHGVVKLMDFGIAKSTTNDNLTRPGTTMGSIYYMSPEQVRGSTVDSRSDIYSFGVTLYEMLTGKKPFEAETSYSVLNAQLNDPPVPPLQLNPSLPPQLNTIVLRAMEKRPEDRFQTADEFRNALRAVHEPQTAQAMPQPQPMPQPSVPTVPYSATQSFGQAPPPRPTPQPAPPPAPQQGFTSVSVPVSPTQNNRKSHRTLWMGLGAAAVVLILVALAAVLPRFSATHAGQNSNAAAGTQAAAVAPAPANTSSSPMAPVPPPQTAAAIPQSNSPAAPASAAPANGTNHERPLPAVAASPAAASASRPAAAAAQPAAQPGPAPAATAAAPPPPSGPSPQEIRQARDRFTDLNARAQSAAAGVQQLRAQQQAQGLDIRGDILTAMNRMNSDMAAANQSLSQKDLDAAADYMNRADKEISTLEKFQGR